MSATMMVAADFRRIGGVTVRTVRASDCSSEAWIRRMMRDPHAAAKRARDRRVAASVAGDEKREVPVVSRVERIERALARCTPQQRDALIAACIAAY